jgi:GTP pyrophosphokinase
MDFYNKTFLSRQELITKLVDLITPVEMNLIVSAHEMAEHIHEFQKRLDGTPYFWHVTRTVKIIVHELKIFDSDIICAALLHDALEDSDILTPEIISFNFGPYISYLVESLTKHFKLTDESKALEEINYLERIKNSSVDCLIIKLAERLDNFRCLQYGVKENPVKYIKETMEEYIPIAEEIDNESIKTLHKLLKIERAKFLN